jgi:hypothetical protein
MTQENSKSSSNTAITTPSTFVRRTFVRRHARFLSWCVVPSVCMTLGLSSALAATNGTGNVHIPGGGKSSAPTGSVNQRDQAQKFILGATLAEWTQRFWSRFMATRSMLGQQTIRPVSSAAFFSPDRFGFSVVR